MKRRTFLKRLAGAFGATAALGYIVKRNDETIPECCSNSTGVVGLRNGNRVEFRNPDAQFMFLQNCGPSDVTISSESGHALIKLRVGEGFSGYLPPNARAAVTWRGLPTDLTADLQYAIIEADGLD